MYVYRSKDVDMARCRRKVHHHFRSHQCYRNGVVEEDGMLWCRQHSPSAQEARDKKSHDLYEARVAPQRAKNQIIRVACNLFHQAATMDELEAAVVAYEKLREKG